MLNQSCADRSQATRTSTGPPLLLRAAGRNVAWLRRQMHAPEDGVALFVAEGTRIARRLLTEDKHPGAPETGWRDGHGTRAGHRTRAMQGR